MKKFGVIALSVLTAAVMLAGCASKPAAGKDVPMADVEKVLKEQAPAAMSMGEKPTAEEATALFHLNMDDVEEYYIDFSMINVQADNIVAVKAKDGKVDSVKASLEQRKSDVEKSFETYLPDKYEMAKNGKVFTKGNYAFLIIHENADKAETEIDNLFK